METFVGSAHRHGRKVKIMRSGRHTQPSQVEKVAEKAGKAAPVMAISAGALVAVPHGHAVTTVKHGTVAEAVTTAKTQHDSPAGTASAAQAIASAKVSHTGSTSLDAARQSQAHTAKAADAAVAGHDYTVRSGDTLSAIASQAYGKASDWQQLYHANKSTISDPNEIFVNQVVKIPASTTTATTTAKVTQAGYQARHAKAARMSASQAHAAHLAHVAHETREAQAAQAAHEAHLAHLNHLNHRAGAAQSESAAANAAHEAHLAHLAHLNHSSGHASSSSSSSSSHSSSASTVSETSHSAPVASHGIYSCSALESLWEEAGGSSGTAFMAAEIATAESGGNPNAVSPTDDFGLWQINGSHGSMATLDPLGNARAAISISDGGHDWGAWTTYTSGAYSGRC
jgi:LysM repeat protein